MAGGDGVGIWCDVLGFVCIGVGDVGWGIVLLCGVSLCIGCVGVVGF